MAIGNVPQATGFRFQRMHPALISGPYLAVKGARAGLIPVFFAQSQLDSACSHHMLASVLSILLIAKPSALHFQSHRKYGVSATVFRELREFWHTGIEPEEFVERVNGMALPLMLTAKFKSDVDLDEFAIKSLLRGELVALSIASYLTRKTNHLTLGIGAGGLQHGNSLQTDTLYLLDASGSEPIFRQHNAVLTMVPSTKRRRTTVAQPDVKPQRDRINWQYAAPEWNPEVVRITSAIRFRRAD